jgi:hypothetical protein
MRNRSQGGPESALSKVPGGASGVPSSTGQIVQPQSAPTPFLGRGPGPKPKRFRVLNGGLVMFGNVRTTLRAGKEISEVAYDVSALRKQGIKLEEIVEEPEAEPVPELAQDAVS